MSHLNLETLARLIDESPDPTEAGHLDICEACRTELEALRADAAALRMLPDPTPPIAAWQSLEQQLQREGLMRQSPWVQNLMRLAAVLVIFVLGTVVGVLLRRSPAPQQVATSTPTLSAPIQTVAQSPVHLDTPITTVSQPLNVAQRAPSNAQEAAAQLQQAEKAYVSALSQYSQFNTRAENSGDPVARLAALESIVATTRAALAQSPSDPVINGYHLTAVAQRDATIRQINASTKQQNWY